MGSIVTECCTHFHSGGCNWRRNTCPHCSYWLSAQLAQYWVGMLLCYGRWLWWYLPPLPKWQDLGTKRELLSLGIYHTEYIRWLFSLACPLTRITVNNMFICMQQIENLVLKSSLSIWFGKTRKRWAGCLLDSVSRFWNLLLFLFKSVHKLYASTKPMQSVYAFLGLVCWLNVCYY